MRSGSPTIRHVAQAASVSVASVSRTLNGVGGVHPDTRARVLAAVEALGYFPHAGARSLSLARTHAIGVVLPDLHGEFFSEIVRGMDREAGTRGYHLLLSNMHADAALAAQAIRSMRGRVDGLIVMAPQIDPAGLDAALPPDMPAVLVNSTGSAARAAFRTDNATGIAAVVAHLVASGRRNLVHVAGPLANIDGHERREAFRAAMAHHAPDIEPIVIEGDFRDDSGAAAVDQLRLRGVAFDGIVAGNDMMALGVMRALRDMGRAVPGAVAVSGFDDIPMARYLDLTTIRVRLADTGARAVARLVDALEGGTLSAETQTIATELVIRASTGPKLS